jgi:putative endonuclease
MSPKMHLILLTIFVVTGKYQQVCNFCRKRVSIMSNKNWVVYLVRCSDKSLYCGVSNNIKNRLAEHNSGKGAKYTRSRRPVKLVGISSQLTKSEAFKLEYRIKKLPVDKKIVELKDEASEMEIYKSDLQALNKNIKALERKIDELSAKIQRMLTSSVE